MSAQELPGLGGVTVERGVECALRDGVVLRADVYRPAEPGTHPVVLLRLPYDRAVAESDVGFAHPSWFARRGYVVVVQDCRGRHGSDGDWYPFRFEAEDGYDTVEWAARLPGANGRVGMYGFSYPGALQLQAAALRPPSLVTICPCFTTPQFHEGWTYDGGAFALAFAGSWATFLALDEARRRGDDEALSRLGAALASVADAYWTLPLRGFGPLAGGPDGRYFFDWLEHEAYDDYWRSLAVEEDWSRVDLPALHVGGWYDVFVAGTVASFVELSRRGTAPQRLVVGPWYHMPWGPLAGAQPAAGPNVVDDVVVAWFDRFLRDGGAAADEAPVTVYVLFDGWRDLDAWPPAATRATEWYLHSRGRANTAAGDGTLSTEPPGDEPADVFVYNPAAPPPSAGGHSCCLAALAPMGPACQAEREAQKGVLVYTTDVLEQPLELVGDVTLTLFAATTALDTDFTARLCVVDDEGCSTNLLEGIIRGRYRDSPSSPTLLEPGRVYELRIALGPIAVRVEAGQRLRVQVSSSDFPQWDRNLNTGNPVGSEGPTAAVTATQFVLHDMDHPSRISLPVLG